MGSEMCIRDRHLGDPTNVMFGVNNWDEIGDALAQNNIFINNDIYLATCAAGKCDINTGAYAENILEGANKEEIEKYMFQIIENIDQTLTERKEWGWTGQFNTENLYNVSRQIEGIDQGDINYAWLLKHGFEGIDISLDDKGNLTVSDPADYLNIGTDDSFSGPATFIGQLQQGLGNNQIYATSHPWETIYSAEKLGLDIENLSTEDILTNMLYRFSEDPARSDFEYGGQDPKFKRLLTDEEFDEATAEFFPGETNQLRIIDETFDILLGDDLGTDIDYSNPDNFNMAIQLSLIHI